MDDDTDYDYYTEHDGYNCWTSDYRDKPTQSSQGKPTEYQLATEGTHGIHHDR